MANEEHLRILKQGAAAWNKWRAQNAEVQIDLSQATLNDAHLRGTNLVWAHLREAHLSQADLRETNLSQADLSEADLSQADLSEANLSQADFGNAFLSSTIFALTDLSSVRGLDSCKYFGPSSLDFHTLRSSGHLPLSFLRGCGLPDNLIEYLPSLLNQAIQFYSCFISYSSRDEAFAQRLYADLQNAGVRCWFAPEDMPIGARQRTAIDEAIRIYDKLLLVLSKKSVDSDWVEKEVETAFEKERKHKQTVLYRSGVIRPQ